MSATSNGGVGNGRDDGTAESTVRVQVVDDLAAIDAAAWNALADTSAQASPFTRHEYLLALHRSASAVPETGWAPQFLCVKQGHTLLAACPLYLKSHSYGEYVFDWAWADAWERAGGQYYPKLLAAVPFTPVPGPRLLARNASSRRLLLEAIEAFAGDARLSSAHVLFLDDADRAAVRQQGWMERSTVQFHWLNREPQPYADFGEFAASLQRDKRRKMLQERRYVREAGVSFEARQGTQISSADWDFFYRCYRHTYRAHRSTPYLTREFFAEVAATMPQHWLLFIAMRAGQAIGCSLVALDPVRGNAFGRYWGAIESVNCLHFEACYYQPLEWCIANGYRRFEGGAQGEHKMARGLMPVRTWSAHWLADAQFAGAVRRFLQSEDAGLTAYVDELSERNPFKAV
jgi:predicted N-acyltransferase